MTWTRWRKSWRRIFPPDAIVEAQARVARQYFEDGSVEAACPPLQALLHIMASGYYRGKGIDDGEVRGMFTREYLMASDWYRERLRTKQRRDVHLWTTTCAHSSDSGRAATRLKALI